MRRHADPVGALLNIIDKRASVLRNDSFVLGTITALTPSLVVKLDTGQTITDPMAISGATFTVGQRVLGTWIQEGHDLALLSRPPAGGWCVTTIHDFSADTNWTSNYFGQTGAIAISPDKAHLYALNIAVGLMRVDLATFVVTPTWAPFALGTPLKLSVDPVTGDVWTIDGNSQLSKVTASGTVTNGVTNAPTGYDFVNSNEQQTAILGDSIYGGVGLNASPFTETIAIWSILGATWTVLTPDLDATHGERYLGMCVASDGTIWIAMRPPATTDPDYGIATILRRAVPAGGGSYTITDIPIQDLVFDSFSEALGGIFIDAADHVLVPMQNRANPAYPTPPPNNYPDIGWWLRVTPSGVATRIAGTWSYVASPAPAATTTDIADGPLNTSLACVVQDGAAISPDGTLVLWLDTADQVNGLGSDALLRKLALCGSP